MEEQPKIKSEKQMRQNLLALGRRLNCEIEVKQIFDRYDNLYKNSRDKIEKEQIGIMAIAELHRFFMCAGELVVNGKSIIPQDPSFKEKDQF